MFLLAEFLFSYFSLELTSLRLLSPHSMEAALFKVTSAIHIAKLNSKFSTFIFLDLWIPFDMAGNCLLLEILFYLVSATPYSSDFPPANCRYSEFLACFSSFQLLYYWGYSDLSLRHTTFSFFGSTHFKVSVSPHRYYINMISDSHSIYPNRCFPLNSTLIYCLLNISV